MAKNYIYQLVYRFNNLNDAGFKLLNAFLSIESAQTALKTFVDDLKKKDKWLKKVFKGSDTPVDSCQEYTEKEDYFIFIDNDYEAMAEVYIEKIELIN